MPKDQRARIRAIELEVTDFLSEYARYLIDAGATYPRLSALMRLALFKAAASRATFGNKKLNQSAVAAMTGLTRVQVRRLAREDAPAARESRDRLESVIDGWITDSSFATPGGRPRRLRVGGVGRSFGALVRKYGGDVPPKALLREMQRHGYVDLGEGHVSLRKSVRHSREENRLRRLSSTLATLIRSAEDVSPTSVLRSISVQVVHPATSERGRALLGRRVGEGLRGFAERVQAAGMAAAMEAPPAGRRKNVVSRTRIVLVTEDFEKGSEMGWSKEQKGGG